MSRRELREQIFKLIFRAEFYDKEELPEQEKLFFEDYELNMKPEDETYISEKSNKILETRRQRAGQQKEWVRSS